MLSVVRDLLESLVCRGKNGVVGLGAIESLNKVIVLVDQFSKLGGVLALVDELVDCPVGLVITMVRRTVMRWTIVRWVVRWVLVAATKIDGSVVE